MKNKSFSVGDRVTIKSLHVEGMVIAMEVASNGVKAARVAYKDGDYTFAKLFPTRNLKRA